MAQTAVSLFQFLVFFVNIFLSLSQQKLFCSQNQSRKYFKKSFYLEQKMRKFNNNNIKVNSTNNTE